MDTDSCLIVAVTLCGESVYYEFDNDEERQKFIRRLDADILKGADIQYSIG